MFSEGFLPLLHTSPPMNNDVPLVPNARTSARGTSLHCQWGTRLADTTDERCTQFGFQASDE